MARQTPQDQATHVAPRRRPLPLRPATAGLAAALSAALAIPALTITGGAALAGPAAGRTPVQHHSGPVTGDGLAVPGAAAAGAASSHVQAWGHNDFGQLGNGGAVNSDTPLRVHLPGGWRASAIGSGPVAGHALAIVHRKT